MLKHCWTHVQYHFALQMDVDDERSDRGYGPRRRWGHGAPLSTVEGNTSMYCNAYFHGGSHRASTPLPSTSQHYLNAGSLRRRHSSWSPPPLPNRESPTLQTSRNVYVPNQDMVTLPIDDISDDEIPSRRNAIRRQNREYLLEMRNAHAEGRRAKHVIHTNSLGDIVDQKSLWHRAVRALGRTELDWKIKSYRQHPEAWSYICKNIQRELNIMFVFVPKPVKPGYLEKYLSITITKDRYEWRKQWKESGTRHRKCPQEAYDLWVPHWSSEAGRIESENMAGIRSLKKQRSEKPQASDSLTLTPVSNTATRVSNSAGAANHQLHTSLDQVCDGEPSLYRFTLFVEHMEPCLIGGGNVGR